jgi:hypothetical protein
VEPLAPRTGDEPAREIVLDMAKRGLLISPLLVIAGAIGWGRNGALSVLFALGVVLLNFLMSAWIIRKATSMPQMFIMVSVLGGFALRMLIVVAAINVAALFSLAERVPLGLTIIVMHLGLLAWETRHVSGSLAYPGLKPRKGDA